MANFYSVTKELEINSNLNSTTYIDAGIHENLLLVDVVYDTSDKGNEFLAFYFENASGDKLSHTEWPVNPIKPFDTMTSEEREAFLEKIDNQKRRIGQIVTTFVSRDKYEFQVNSFKEYAENIINILKGSLRTVPVRVKVVYNKKNFTTLPNYWKYIFIEPMTIAKENSKIRILSIDNMVKAKPNVKSEPIFDSVTDKVEDKQMDEIPF